MKKKYITLLSVLLLAIFFMLNDKRKNENLSVNKKDSVASDVFAENSELKKIEKINEEDNNFDSSTERPLEEVFAESMEAFASFKDLDHSFKDTFKFLKEIGADPGPAIENEIGEITFSSTEAVGELRYFRVKYDGENNPSWFMFEVAPSEGVYERTLGLLKKNYKGIGEPCFKDQENIMFEDDEFLVHLHIVNNDDIEQGDTNKPRAREDIGSVEVTIEYDHHPGSCENSNG